MVINKAKISCKGVWKLYGDGAEKFFQQHRGNPDPEAISANGYIPAVKNVTFDVQVGKILVVMGLSGSGKTTGICFSSYSPLAFRFVEGICQLASNIFTLSKLDSNQPVVTKFTTFLSF